MGFFDKLFGGKGETGGTKAAALSVSAPFAGKVIPLEEVPDPVFGEGILGPGCGMEAEEETVYAPFDGTVTQTTDTKHAVGVTSADGIELLIHVGLDTVAMGGEGFACLVKEGDAIKLGQPLMTFSKAAIQAAGHPTVTAIVITNSDEFAGVIVEANGPTQRGDKLFQLSK